MPKIETFNRPTSIDDIIAAVRSHYQIDLQSFMSRSRLRTIARPRQIAMYFARQMTPHSLPEIGRLLGGYDHSTIKHGIDTITEMRRLDLDLDRELMIIRQKIVDGDFEVVRIAPLPARAGSARSGYTLRADD